MSNVSSVFALIGDTFQARIGIWKCWLLWRWENWSTWRKTSRSREENQQQTQPTYDDGSGNRTRDILVGGERSHHCAIPAPKSFFTICLGLYVLVIHLLCRQMIHTTAELVLPYDINCLGTSLKKLGGGISWASCKTETLNYTPCKTVVSETNLETLHENVFH